ncbi:MAG: glutathionylspermidine synthase family protein, partial [Campylobacterota bacterium]|nr:glutathionylspermidine synthase family protein [Campylobacterota bacterium]
MPNFLDIEPISKDSLEKMGFTWHIDSDGEYIVRDKLIALTQEEVQAFHDASNELYSMYEKGAQYVVENELFEALDIPPSLVPLIKESWKNERENHLYGRFDLSGGIDSKPIKLIEFNADTPTLLLETTVIQLMMLQFNKLENAEQFNYIYEA